MYAIIVYDIKVERVNKVKGYLRKHLNWIQNSVFEGDITLSELENISSIDDIQANHIVLKMTDEKKSQVMTLFLGMAKADGFIHPKEIEIINQILQDL